MSLLVIGLWLFGLLIQSFGGFLGFLASFSSSRNGWRSVGLLGALLDVLLGRDRSTSLLFWWHLEDVIQLVSQMKLILAHHSTLYFYVWRADGGQVGVML